MRLNSISTKLLAIIVGAFLVSIVAILILADLQLKRILDESQEAVYAEKVETIEGFLQRRNERLKKTGLVEAYADDFKESALAFLRKNYYTQPDPAIYPFILHTSGTVIMHPVLARGDQSMNASVITKTLISADDGQFDAIYRGQPNWYRYRSFEEWEWVIAYAVPLSIKYRDAHVFRNTLIVIAAGVTVVVLLILALVVRRFTRPIIKLTDASKQIAGGKLDQAIDVGGRDEIGILADTFTNMRTAIKKQIVALNNEIGERKRLEKAHMETSTMLRLVLDNIPVRVFWKDLDCRYLGCNQPFAEDAGHSDPNDLIGQNDFDFPWSRQEAEAFQKDDRAVMRSGRPRIGFEEPQTHHDGATRWLQTSKIPMRDEKGQIIGVLGTYEDITQRKKAEEELYRLRNYLSNIINSMPSILVGVDTDGAIIQWNRKAKQVTGLSAEDVLGKPLDQALPRFATEMERVREAIRNRQELTDAKRSRHVKGDIVFEDVTIYPLITNGVEGAVIRIDDVTEQVRMEEMMIQSEKMLSVGGLAAGMAHEINNPLAGMIQTARVMANRLDIGSTIKANLTAAEEAGTSMEAIGTFMEKRGILRMVDTVVESGQRVADIVANMLSFTRKSESRISSHSLVDLLDRTLELAATDYDLKKHYDFKLIKVVKQYAEYLPAVPCEGAKVQQVLLNILRNGAQAMQEKGTENPRFTVRAYVDDSTRTACMEIEDNGPGMDEATRKRVFEPFFTTKPVGVGTGLGLSVSYFIITENHKGQMTVESTPGRGTTFFIRLPLEGARE